MQRKLLDVINTLSIREQIMLTQILYEYNRADSLFGPFTCPHEGYAVILEELDETWEVIKKRTQEKNEIGPNAPELMAEEVKSVGAMALRFMVDLC